MGQGQGKGGSGRTGTNSMIRSVLRSGPTPVSDALVGQDQALSSDRHITSRRETNRVTQQHFLSEADTAPSTDAPAAGKRQAEEPPSGSESRDSSLEPVEKPDPTFPVVIRFTVPRPPSSATGTPPPPPSVMLLLEHRNWEPFPMSASGEDFFAIIELPKGHQAYKFTVNGQEVLDPNKPQQSHGVAANVISVAEAGMATTVDPDPVDEEKDWGQEQNVFEETKKMPPILPPHLRYTPLNTPLTQFRQDSEGKFGLAADGSFVDREHLPLPLSVSIDHVYFQRREDHTVLGVTTRYRNKFATVVYYKGAEKSKA